MRSLQVGVFVSLIAILSAGYAEGQEVEALKALDSTANTVVPPTYQVLGKPHLRTMQAAADIQVTYSSNFPQEAIEAYEYAAGIWETHLSSGVQIDVEAEWIELDPRTLGAAGPAVIDRDFPGAPRADTWYPDALVETIRGTNTNPVIGGVTVTADVTSQFNSNLDIDGDGSSDWYFGTDTNTPSGMYNFATVVLHELGHGLGFIGTFDVGDEPCGGSDLGCWGIPANGGDPLPLIYDRFAEDISGASLLNTGIYPNPSEVLADTIQSDNVLFDSPTVRLVNEGIAVNLYAPGNFEVGSSYSHLDENSFPPGTINSLMTPFLARQETIYTPGPATCGIMQTMGWPLGPDCEVFFPQGDLIAFNVQRNAEGNVALSWQLQSTTSIDRFIAGWQYFNRGFIPFDTVTVAAGETSYSTTFEPERAGSYTFRLRQILSGGTEIVPLQGDIGYATLFIPLEDEALISVFPNPFDAEASVSVLAAESQQVRVRMYNALGQEIGRLFSGRVEAEMERRIRLNGGGLAAGTYFIYVLGDEFREVIPVTHF